MTHTSFQRLPTTTTIVELAVKIATAFLISFAATLVLVHAEVYFARSLILLP
jgi:hypothetical protein